MNSHLLNDLRTQHIYTYYKSRLERTGKRLTYREVPLASLAQARKEGWSHYTMQERMGQVFQQWENLSLRFPMDQRPAATLPPRADCTN